MRSLIAFVVLALSACGNVASDGTGGGGGAGGAAGGSTTATGGAGSAGASGGEAAAGANGGATATGGRGEGGSGEGGHFTATGGRGEGGSEGGRAGATGTGGAGGGVLTAPTCKGNFIGSTQPECPRIADPKNPTNPNAGWQCEVGCSDVASDNATGCVLNGVSYCVSSCSACHL